MARTPKARAATEMCAAGRTAGLTRDENCTLTRFSAHVENAMPAWVGAILHFIEWPRPGLESP